MVQLERFLGKLLRLLIKTGLPLIGSLLKPLAKSVLVPLGLTAAAAATDGAILKKIFGSGHPSDSVSRTTTLNDITKIIKSLKDSDLLIKDITETVEVKEQKGGFWGMLASGLGASALGNMLRGKGVFRAGQNF